MIQLALPTAVFVPFEWDGHDWKVRDDLPRFLEPRECVQYIKDHPELSKRFIDWQERSEKRFLEEYARGVGTK